MKPEKECPKMGVENRMKIEEYGFGSMTINGKDYKNDVIILPDKIISDWWRKEGHKLHLEDLEFFQDYTPKVIVVGCGYNGLMKITREVRDYCTRNNIELLEENSRRAVKVFNDMSGNPDVVGAFHLTC